MCVCASIERSKMYIVGLVNTTKLPVVMEL